MIPRLLNANVTDFTQVGIPLTDTEYCKVKEERNGVFELELRVATTTPYFEELEVGKIIVAKPNHDQGLQAFEIYEITRPILQRVTVRANHISYRTSFIPVTPFSCTGITETLNGLITNSMETNPFTFNTTITNEQSTYNQTAPASLRSRLGGTEGSVLDVFGGEYKWDNYTINLLLHRGTDNGVELRVAKNISDLEQTKNMENVVTGALPYWSNEDGTIFFYGDIQYSSAVSDYDYKRTVVLDLSEEFESAPSESQLNSAAQEYLSQVNLGIPTTNIKLSFVDLADTDEYKDSPLERVNLCDTVTVLYYPLLISYKAKVISLTFDVLAERTLEVEVGDSKSTISKTISDLVGDVSSVVRTGKKLISVTQKIDRELGEVTTTVASVQEKTDTLEGNVTDLRTDLDTTQDNLESTNNTITTIQDNVSTIQQTTTSIQTQVSQTQTTLQNDYATKSELSSSVSSLSTSIEQTAKDITLTITDVQTILNEQGSQITTLETYIRATSRGLEISRSSDEVTMVLSNTELAFYNKANTKLAWLDSSDGLGASGLSIGDANTASNRWRIFTRQSGSHLTFTRHS